MFEGLFKSVYTNLVRTLFGFVKFHHY
jgi:hypothetical protein